ncbi:MAG: hypothetical protein QOE83_693 [Actinomycetota bacterium]|jgi:LCP family protein required for cell wall assembly|nr:hypothetical protein [Actinomycetota bacterium]
MSEGSHRPRRTIRIAISAAASLSLIIGAATAYAYVLVVQNNGTGTSCFADCSSSGPSVSSKYIGPCASRSCNYLLLGSDSRSNLSHADQVANGTNAQAGAGDHSDVIMVVHTEPDGKTVILSFPRDLWVNIPGLGKGKINSAFAGGIAGGGPARVAQTVSQITGLKISHFLAVDLGGFQGVVDSIDGIDMCLPATEAGPDGWLTDPNTQLHLQPGCQHLDGQQVLSYVRSRHLPCDVNGDFNRISRQQAFLRAVINRMLQPSELLKIPGFIKPVLSNLKRDKGLTIADLAYLTGQLHGLSSGDVLFRNVPVKLGQVTVPEYTFPLDVEFLDPSAQPLFKALRDNSALPADTTLPGTPISESQITIPVVDHASAGKAAGVETILSQAGFDISPAVVPYATFDSTVKGTVIAYSAGSKDAADQAAVVHSYFLDVPMKAVPAKLLGGNKVALFVTAAYQPPSTSTPEPTTSSGCLPAA